MTVDQEREDRGAVVVGEGTGPRVRTTAQRAPTATPAAQSRTMMTVPAAGAGAAGIGGTVETTGAEVVYTLFLETSCDTIIFCRRCKFTFCILV